MYVENAYLYYIHIHTIRESIHYKLKDDSSLSCKSSTQLYSLVNLQHISCAHHILVTLKWQTIMIGGYQMSLFISLDRGFDVFTMMKSHKN